MLVRWTDKVKNTEVTYEGRVIDVTDGYYLVEITRQMAENYQWVVSKDFVYVNIDACVAVK
jgi:hypothetical protein